jgi:hypothetical protein
MSIGSHAAPKRWCDESALAPGASRLYCGLNIIAVAVRIS